MAMLKPKLLNVASKLPRRFFVHAQCPRQASVLSRINHHIKASFLHITCSNPRHTLGGNSSEASLSILSKSIWQKSSRDQKIHPSQFVRSNSTFFPETTAKPVAYWLLASAASVFGIVVLGGLTRLTESGLSITEWRPVSGSLPPLSQADWDSEFEKYRASPEFHQLNPHITLSEFKKIYYMEWGHRLWGRFVGLSFVLPAIYFVSRRKVSFPMSLRLLSISGLIGVQGFLGWYMVKSGLKDDLFNPGAHPRVSQYRLAAHLGTAFTCFTAMLWNGLAILRTHTLLRQPAESHKLLLQLSSPILARFRKSAFVLFGMIFTTALSGAFVAGLDAGLIYNQFPSMGDGLHPPKDELLDPSYCQKSDQSDLIWRNMLENPSTVQLDHRALAVTTFTAILSLWAYSRFSPRVRKTLPDSARKAMLSVVHLAFIQVSLGISTLIYLVPTPLAAMHQAGALALLTGATFLGSRIWIPRRTWELVKGRLHSAAAVHAKRPEMAQVIIKQMRIRGPPHV
ncbi:Electron transfer protein 1 [Podosphaera aphanis]|nr:Electron transfer protein 1 [Podosphaera aphanis]